MLPKGNIYILNHIDPSIEPCGTPWTNSGVHGELVPVTEICLINITYKNNIYINSSSLCKRM